MLMTVVSTLFYSVNMVVAELLFDHISIAAFVFLKHILPYFANIAVPILVIVTQDDIRGEAKVGWTVDTYEFYAPGSVCAASSWRRLGGDDLASAEEGTACRGWWAWRVCRRGGLIKCGPYNTCDFF